MDRSSDLGRDIAEFEKEEPWEEEAPKVASTGWRL